MVGWIVKKREILLISIELNLNYIIKGVET